MLDATPGRAFAVTFHVTCFFRSLNHNDNVAAIMHEHETLHIRLLLWGINIALSKNMAISD